MNTVAKNSRLLVIVVLLSTLLFGQLVYAQESRGCTETVPQWVKDRQQYETTYVYVSMANNIQSVELGSHTPQWVRDRQQYETTYVYSPSASDLQAIASGSAVPQWVRDRQQYETTYVYVPMLIGLQTTDNVC